jgi:hypothetical protein
MGGQWRLIPMRNFSIDSVKSWVELTGSTLALLVVLIAGFEYFSGRAVLSDLTADTASRYQSEIFPALAVAEEYQLKFAKELREHNSSQYHAEMIKAYVESKDALTEVVGATEALDDMVRCQDSWLCNVKNFSFYEQRLRRYWFTFKPIIYDLRSNDVLPEDFGSHLESKAIEILERDRAAGRLPLPSKN